MLLYNSDVQLELRICGRLWLLVQSGCINPESDIAESQTDAREGSGSRRDNYILLFT